MADKDILKLFESKYKDFQDLCSAKMSILGTEFRCDFDLNERAQTLYSMLKGIDEKSIKCNNRDTFYFRAADVLTQLGLYKLRVNHYFTREGEKINLDFLFFQNNNLSIENIEEKIVSYDALQESTSFMWEALEYLSKIVFDKKTKETLQNRLYHNLLEAYNTLNDTKGKIECLEIGARNNDIMSIYELVQYYCSLEEFHYSKIINLYNNLKISAQLVFSEQTNDKNIANIMTKEIYILPCLKTMVEALIKHSFYDSALEIARSLKNDYVEYAVWDSQFESEINKDVARWEKKIQLSRGDVVPSDKILAHYFNDSVISLMTNDIKIYVGTSLHVYNELNGFSEFTVDYSAAIIPLFKALEIILYKIAIDGYFEYMCEHYKDYTDIIAPSCIFDRKNKKFVSKERLERFDLGMGLNILCKSISNEIKENEKIFLPNTGVEDFLKSKCIADSRNKIVLFCKNIERCRIYRNITAHRNRVNKTLADDAKSIIMDTVKVIEKAYLEFGNLL